MSARTRRQPAAGVFVGRPSGCSCRAGKWADPFAGRLVSSANKQLPADAHRSCNQHSRSPSSLWANTRLLLLVLLVLARSPSRPPSWSPGVACVHFCARDKLRAGRRVFFAEQAAAAGRTSKEQAKLARKPSPSLDYSLRLVCSSTVQSIGLHRTKARHRISAQLVGSPDRGPARPHLQRCLPLLLLRPYLARTCACFARTHAQELAGVAQQEQQMHFPRKENQVHSFSALHCVRPLARSSSGPERVEPRRRMTSEGPSIRRAGRNAQISLSNG